MAHWKLITLTLEGRIARVRIQRMFQLNSERRNFTDFSKKNYREKVHVTSFSAVADSHTEVREFVLRS
jgi:hypothetical protein